MEATRRFQAPNLAIGALAIGHAALTWPLETVVALFVGGAAIAFVAEVIGVAAGLVDHAITPKVLGVPISVVIVWPAVTYVCLRIALLVLPLGLAAAVLAALVGTAFDLVTEPVGLAEGVWRYPDHPLSDPRIVGVPWWNAVAWFGLLFATASIPIVVGI